MDDVRTLLIHGLVFVGLLLGTIEYGVIILRRSGQRRRAAELLEAQQTGLQGLVRTMIRDVH